MKNDKTTSKVSVAAVIKRITDSEFSVSVLALLITLVVLAVMAVIFGANPWQTIASLFEGALVGKKPFLITLNQMSPLILAAFAVYIPFKSGFFNIGGQGQLELSALAAVQTALLLQGTSPWIAIPICLIVAVIVGILTVMIPLLLKVKRGVNEVTTTIMMNFTCTNLVYGLISTVFKDPDAWYGTTLSIPKAFELPSLPSGSGIHVGVYISVAVALIAAWFMKNTVGGMRLKSVGLNRDASMVSGINVQKTVIMATIVGAACAGLAGGIQAMGVSYRIAENWAQSWGFSGLTIAFLGANPLGIIPVSFVLAILETGSRFMQSMTGIPAAVLNMMQGVPVIAFICLTALRRRRLSRKKTVKVVEKS